MARARVAVGCPCGAETPVEELTAQLVTVSRGRPRSWGAWECGGCGRTVQADATALNRLRAKVFMLRARERRSAR